MSSHVCVCRFSQDKDISAIKINPGTLQRFHFFFSAQSPPFHLGFWNNHPHQNGTLKSIYQMGPPLEKVLELSINFSFISSRAIFRIHARSQQLVAHAQGNLHSPTCVDITTKFSRLNKLPGSDRALRAPLWEDDKSHFTSEHYKEP